MIKVSVQKNLLGSDGNIELDANFTVKKGEFIAISGESGSGKTTLLRILAGLEDAKGELEVFGKVWMDKNFVLPTQKREIGFVFQNYALFLNMTVEENLLYVRPDRKLADKLLKVTKLDVLKKRYPQSLSGGQQQRVALARALMNKPKLLLLDEPLSALDRDMREILQSEILFLHKEFNTTTILVSHDRGEIEKLCDRVLILDKGKLIKDEKKNSVCLDGEVLGIDNNTVTIKINSSEKLEPGKKVSLQLHN